MAKKPTAKEELARVLAGNLTHDELLGILHALPIEGVSKLKDMASDYLSTWFGFSREAKAKQTPEWIAAATHRLAGQTEPCCKCGEDYPRADLHFGEEIYCAKCRVIEAERMVRRKAGGDA